MPGAFARARVIHLISGVCAHSCPFNGRIERLSLAGVSFSRRFNAAVYVFNVNNASVCPSCPAVYAGLSPAQLEENAEAHAQARRELLVEQLKAGAA